MHAYDFIGSVKRLDVTRFVRSCAGGNGACSFVFARQLRAPLSGYIGNAAGPVAGDNLFAAGQTVSFYSKENPTGEPPQPTLKPAVHTVRISRCKS